MSKLGTMPNVEDIFPDTDTSVETFKEILSHLSKTDTLIWCFRINHILGEFNKKTDEQIQIAQLFFSKDQIDKMKPDDPDIRFTVTTKGAATLLAKWACVLCDDKETDGSTFEDPKVREEFAKALLISNQYWLKNSGMDRLALDEPIEIKRREMLCAFRQNAAGSESRLQPPINGIAKGYQMFIEPGFFPAEHASFQEEFQSVAKYSIEDYYICLTYLVSGQGPDIIDGKKLIDVEQAIGSVPEDFKPTFRQFFDNESQDINELTEAFWKDCDPSKIEDIADTPGFNDTPLRTKPIFRIHDGRMIVMDPILFFAKTTDGPMFTLLKTGNYEPKSLIGEFGKSFEKYAQKYLGKMFVVSNSYHYPLLDNKGNEHADACISHNEDLVLIEMKASFLPQEKVINNDNEEYVRLLKERYVWDPKKNEAKGVTQLANSIKKIASDRGSNDSVDLSGVKTVFPLLLVHDELIDAHMHPHFFHNEFIDQLSPDKIVDNYLIKGDLLISPLILMTMEDLESVSFLVKRGFSLIELFKGYTTTFPERLESLHNYYAYKELDLKVCQILATQGLKNIQKTKDRLFPKST